MKIKAIFFDLDGTLLPMNQDVFVRRYFHSLTEYLTSCGYDEKKFYHSLLRGIDIMQKNNGSITNENAFWKSFISDFGGDKASHEPNFDAFYNECFDSIKEVTSKNPAAALLVDKIKKSDITILLATNPVFPKIATEKRIGWAGLSPKDFDVITTYENSSYSKPSLGYYKELISSLGLSCEECLMVGNDVSDDMIPASELGMQTFLLTDCLINSKALDTARYPKGSFSELEEYIFKNI